MFVTSTSIRDVFVPVLWEEGGLANGQTCGCFSQLRSIAVTEQTSKLGRESANSVKDSSPSLCWATCNCLVHLPDSDGRDSKYEQKLQLEDKNGEVPHPFGE